MWTFWTCRLNRFYVLVRELVGARSVDFAVAMRGVVLNRSIAILFVLVFLSANAVAQGKALVSFPGAEGNGAISPGGRGGDVHLVTNLNDSGVGSLREGCEAEGRRIVVINVSGVIELESPIEVRNPFITVAGQVAPGDGVCLKNYGLHISASDVVVRYLRIRPGDAPGEKLLGIGIADAERVVIDHCSISWTTGSAVAVKGSSRDITVQWCMITESLYDAEARDLKRGTGINLSANSTFSFHHNYIAHHKKSGPMIDGPSSRPEALLDFRNNMVYDWGTSVAEESGSPFTRCNLVRNIYKAGTSTAAEAQARVFRLRSFSSKIHFEGNELVGSEMGTANNFLMLQMPDRFSNRHHGDMLKLDGPFHAEPVRTLQTSTALRHVLAESGASKPGRDAVDTRLIAQYRLGAGRLIADPLEVGGWPEYEMVDPPLDSDRDGMPDEWEVDHDLDPTNRADSASDRDDDGYTNIEEFLNSNAPDRLNR